MKTITLNLPEPLHAKIIREVEVTGFAGKSDFFRYLAMEYFLNRKNGIPEIDDPVLISYESDMVNSLSNYLKNPKNIAQVVHLE